MGNYYEAFYLSEFLNELGLVTEVALLLRRTQADLIFQLRTLVLP